jgi:hypothetical protein
MWRTTVCALVVLLIVSSAPVFGAERRHGAGFGLCSGSGEPEDGPELDFVGFSIFGKIGFTDHWGLLISYKDMEDDEDLLIGEEDEYTQIGAYGVYMWRHDRTVRPHMKFGFERTELQLSLFGSSIDDDGVAFSLGGGLEAGSQKIAFFGDFDFTTVELFDVDFEIANLTAGVIFKF